MMRIRRAAKTGNFTQLDNAHVLRTKTLSFSARGVLAYLLSLPDEVDSMSAETLAKQGPDGKTKILNALTELREHGYLVTERVRLPGGKTITCQTVHEIPVPVSPSAENQQPVHQQPVDHPSADQTPVVQPLADQQPLHDHPVDQPSEDDLPVDEPLAHQPTEPQQLTAPAPVSPPPGREPLVARAPETRQSNKDRSSNTANNTPPSPTPPRAAATGPTANTRGDGTTTASMPVAAFVDALPVALRPRTSADILALTDALYRFLAVGADPVALAAVVSAAPLPAQVFSPLAFVRSRLDALDPHAHTPAPPRPEWCGTCESDTHRWLDLPDGTARPCPVCSPQARRVAGQS